MKKVLAMLLSLALLAGCSQQTNAPAQTGASGSFTGTAAGRNGDVTVEIVLADGVIADAKVLEHSESFGVGYGMDETPVEAIPAAIVENQTIAVDGVAGATLTSSGVKNAFKAALTEAGVLDSFSAPVEAKEVTTEYDVDVVVVGAGGAGLSAAITAANNGANVLLLEKTGITGGSTTVSGGKTLASGTSIQAEQNITDSADELYAYLTSLGNDENTDLEVVRTFADKSRGAIEFMKNNGVLFGEVERTHLSIPTWRVHNAKDGTWMNSCNGGWITTGLTKSAKDAGVTILFNTPAYELIVNDGTVCGVKAKNGETDITVKAGAVILACGGFTQDFEAMKNAQEFAGLDVTYVNTAGVGNSGDALKMAKPLGAVMNTTAGASYTYCSFTCGAGIYEEAGLIICEDGHRVCNEYSYQYEWTKYLVEHESSCAWYVTDAEDPNMLVQYGLTLDSTVKAESVEELAEKIGCDAKTLEETISKYNSYCQKGVDEEFGKPAEFLNELTGTLYAIRFDRSYSFTFGGLKTNKEAEVINEDGNAIPGLYAAGECAFYSLLGTSPYISYPSCGTAIGSGVVFGIIAAENAVAFAG